MPRKPKNSEKKASFKKRFKPRVFFNASVILAGISSPSGGSAKLLTWVKTKKITGLVSEAVIDEATHRANRIKSTPAVVGQKIANIFKVILPPPEKKLVQKYSHLVLDSGDTHLFASSQQAKANYLVSLDKKHVLSLKEKIKQVNILSPGQLIKKLYRQ